MKWDEIHDQSRVVVDKAIENLLAEGKEVEKKEDDIVGKLREMCIRDRSIPVYHLPIPTNTNHPGELLID